jgi:hypothetical protein
MVDELLLLLQLLSQILSSRVMDGRATMHCSSFRFFWPRAISCPFACTKQIWASGLWSDAPLCWALWARGGAVVSQLEASWKREGGVARRRGSNIYSTYPAARITPQSAQSIRHRCGPCAAIQQLQFPGSNSSGQGAQHLRIPPDRRSNSMRRQPHLYSQNRSDSPLQCFPLC